MAGALSHGRPEDQPMFVVAPHTTALRYEIRVLGRLGPHWSDWFDGFDMLPCGKQATALTGRVADQAALHGFLGKIRDLGLTLVAVRALDFDEEHSGAETPVVAPLPLRSTRNGRRA